MHHPHSASAARRLRIASLLLLANRLLILPAIGLLLVSLFTAEHKHMLLGSLLMAICLLLLMAQCIAARRAGCPLCRTPVLASMGCVKHRNAKCLFGSYSLRVALWITFVQRFRCPYCNEPTSMVVREKRCVPNQRGRELPKSQGSSEPW